MTVKSVLPAILFSTILPLSVSSYAADADKAPPEKPATIPMKPHSHMEEKTGVAPAHNRAETAPAAEGKSGTSNRWKDKSRHNHPRDAK